MNLYICPGAAQCNIECDHKEPHGWRWWCNCDCTYMEDCKCVRVAQSRKPEARTAQVRIIMGSYWGGCFVTFRSQFEIDNDLRGKTYRNPTPESLKRLSTVLYAAKVPCYVDHQEGDIVFGDLQPPPDLF